VQAHSGAPSSEASSVSSEAASVSAAPVPSRSLALSEGVRSRRVALGLRQRELAELAGCSVRFVHALENHKSTLQLDKILDVLEVLGLDLLLVPGLGQVRAEEAQTSSRTTGEHP